MVQQMRMTPSLCHFSGGAAQLLPEKPVAKLAVIKEHLIAR